MPSLKHRVAHQRDTLMARGPGIRLHAERVHTRLRHPAVLIPAFMGGMLIARGAPILRALPKLTGRLEQFTEELGKLDTRLGRISEELGKPDAIIKLIAAVVPILLRPFGAEADDKSDAQSSQKQADTAPRPPPT